jgi:hypothetical protein
MSVTLVQNIAGTSMSLQPYALSLPAAHRVVLADDAATVIALLGGAAKILGTLSVTTVGSEYLQRVGLIQPDVESLPAPADAHGQAPTIAMRFPFTAGLGGAADDVVVYNANAPFSFRILDVQVLVATAIASSNAILRSALAGGGAALSDAFDTSVAGRTRDAGTFACPTIAAGGSLVLRRSKNTTAGEVVLLVQRI